MSQKERIRAVSGRLSQELHTSDKTSTQGSPPVSELSKWNFNGSSLKDLRLREFTNNQNSQINEQTRPKN